MPFSPADEREYYFSALPDWKPPKSFVHNPPEKPDPPAFPDGLSDAEQAEVRAWQGWGATPALTDAVAKVAEYQEHEAAMSAWRSADELARIVQYRWTLVDAAIENKMIDTAGAAEGGEGASDPPPPWVPPHRGEEP